MQYSTPLPRSIWMTGLIGLLTLLTADMTTAQDPQANQEIGKTSAEQSAQTTASDAEVSQKIADKVTEIGKTLSENDAAQDLSGGILKPIYQAAEYLSFPAFHWCAFALMTAGLVSFLLQLVLTKLFLLFKLSLDVKEVLADLLGLLVSAVGLILTTQASTQNSSFTHSPLAVITAAGAGILVGFIFYIWGQKQEFDAVRGSKKSETKKD